MTATPDQPSKKPRKPRSPRQATVTAPPPVPTSSPLRLMGIMAVITFVVDQLLKWLVVGYLDLATVREIDVLYPYLNFRMAWNEGINFGLMSSGASYMRWVLIAVSIVVCAWVTIWIRRTRPGRFAQVAAGLLIGGALGNVIDRINYGAVADFLNMSLPGWSNPYSFNVADIAIFAGAIGLVVQPQAKADAKTGPATDKPRDGRGKTG